MFSENFDSSSQIDLEFTWRSISVTIRSDNARRSSCIITGR